MKTELPGKMTIAVNACARCEGAHGSLEFRKLRRPVVLDFRPLSQAVPEYGWWASCPSTGEPVLMMAMGEEA